MNNAYISRINFSISIHNLNRITEKIENVSIGLRVRLGRDEMYAKM